MALSHKIIVNYVTFIGFRRQSPSSAPGCDKKAWAANQSSFTL